LLCLHTTQTQGYVENLRFPSEFQVGEDVIGQLRRYLDTPDNEPPEPVRTGRGSPGGS
jgi:hypothetical protein